jgi:hypothetical protein
MTDRTHQHFLPSLDFWSEVGAILDACLANRWRERSYRIATSGG